MSRLAEAGIPVVTLVTDLPASSRVAYVGMDNRSAGATAAYLIHQWLGTGPGAVAVTVSNDFFRGEEEREMGFRSAIRAVDPGREVLYLAGSDGLDQTTLRLMGEALARTPTSALSTRSAEATPASATHLKQQAGNRMCSSAMILPRTTSLCCAQGTMSALLHHDLKQDIQRCCRIIMHAHGALPEADAGDASKIEVITPFNIPFPSRGVC